MKIFRLAIVLSLAAVLSACDSHAAWCCANSAQNSEPPTKSLSVSSSDTPPIQQRLSVQQRLRLQQRLRQEKGVSKMTRWHAQRVVYFAFDRSTLSPKAKQVLRRFKSAVVKRGKIRVEGHADERGTYEYNLALGVRRANSVKNYMVKIGVPVESIETVSYGKEKPAANCNSEDCWRKNRRVVIKEMVEP